MLELTSICLVVSMVMVAATYAERQANRARLEAHLQTLSGWSREVHRVSCETFAARHHALNQVSFAWLAALGVAIMAQIVLSRPVG